MRTASIFLKKKMSNDIAHFLDNSQIHYLKKVMKIKVIVTLKNGVLDPQGKAIQQTLNGMNFGNVEDVRQGKYFEIEVKEKDEKKAKSLVDDMCKKLLANLVIEDYKIV